MGTALSGLSPPAPASRTAGASRDAAPVSQADGAPTPFAEVMQAQENPATSQDCTTSPRRASGEGPAGPPRREDARADEAPTPVAEDQEGQPLDGAGVDALLGLCADSASTAEAPGISPQVDFGASTAGVGGLPMPAVVPVPAPPAPLPQDAADAALELIDRRSEALPGLSGLAASPADLANLASPPGLRDAAADDGAGNGALTDAVTLAPGTATAESRATQRTTAGDAAAGHTRPPELRAPLGTPAWADELGSRVTWMLERGEQVASLRLTPENLGPLEVRIAVREGETTVWFGAAQADTRAALEQSLPRLKEMLGASGLALANAGVFSQTPRDPQRGFTAAALARAAQESGAEPIGAAVSGVTVRGLVDLYA